MAAKSKNNDSRRVEIQNVCRYYYYYYLEILHVTYTRRTEQKVIWKGITFPCIAVVTHRVYVRRRDYARRRSNFPYLTCWIKKLCTNLFNSTVQTIRWPKVKAAIYIPTDKTSLRKLSEILSETYAAIIIIIHPTLFYLDTSH